MIKKIKLKKDEKNTYKLRRWLIDIFTDTKGILCTIRPNIDVHGSNGTGISSMMKENLKKSLEIRTEEIINKN